MNQSNKKLAPEKFFLISSLIVGLLLCFLIPIGAGYDEDTHVARIWEISGGNFIPNSLYNSGPNFPSVFYELSYRQKFMLDPVSIRFIAENISRRIDWDNMISHSTRSPYNPLLYIIQAFIMGLLGRIFDAPVLIIYYLCRISYLLIYIALVYLAIRLIPFAKWLLTTLALAPMAITQAAAISADPITNAVCFLFLAYCLHLRFKKDLISKKDLWILLGLIVLLFSVKINGIVLILLLLILPRRKFESKAVLNVLIFGVITLFIIEVIGWNLLAIRSKMPFTVETGVDPIGQVNFILTHLFQFIGIVFNNLIRYATVLIREYIGVMGYRYWAYPSILYILFPIMLVIVFIFDNSHSVRFSHKDRVIVLFTFILGIFVTYSSLYVMINPVGSDLINRDGRYLIPLMPLFFLAIYPSKQITLPGFEKVMVFGNSFILLIMMGSMFFSYYVTCGVNYYTSPGNCYYPVYKNWMPDQRYINQEKEVKEFSQTFISKCLSIDQMRFWVKGNGATLANYEFELVDQKSNQILVRKAFQNPIEVNQGWMNISFDTLEDMYMKPLAFKISADDSQSMPAFAVSIRDEYTDGSLKLGGVDQPFDILFQYYCIPNFWQDINNVFR